MKKILLILIILLTACSKNHDLLYYEKVDQLKEVNESSLNIPFSIDISVDKLTDTELVYQVVIDNPLVDARDMMVLVVHDAKTDNIFPSLGIVDEKVNLIQNEVDLDNNLVKGIALVGYLPLTTSPEITFKVLIEYDDNQNNKNIIYYVYKMTLTDIK